ncbi:hypothetical protein AMEX_G13264 [Astyanax mexicanus]|uniref:Ig-like domain-containing protein n=1 Tax=Astyanax mexicanus TaxID=7994 RepID=A0A8T2LL57_ASTMX|nr:hypothetical protein AMEX_G13264 [Astyanax mexicanus]
MAQVGIIIFFLFKICSVEAVRDSEVFSVNPGDTVPLNCGSQSAAWYKQRLWRASLEAEQTSDDGRNSVIQTQFELKWIESSSSPGALHLEKVSEEDQAMYFCGVKDENTLNFITSAFIDVTGYPQLNVSVDETPVPGSVSPADPVILQCSVLSEIRSAELRVFWFRSAAGSSFPEIIFTHHNSSQPGTHRCVYNFSTNITNNSHAHYCAMATCWRLLPYRSSADLSKLH